MQKIIKLLKRTCRSLFSRYSISACMIILEVGLLLYILLGNIEGIAFLFLGMAATAIPAFLSLINKNTNPEYKVPWVFIILALPYFGPLIYLLFYQRRMSRREARHLGGIMDTLRGEGLGDEDLRMLAEENRLAAGKAYAITNDYPIAGVYRGTSSEFFSTGEKLFSSMLRDLREAKEFIFLEYFIIDEGALWNEIHAILIDKVAEGVDVRLLYDDIGCMKTLPQRYPVLLNKQGIKTHRFNEVNPRVSAIHHNRDHRKICIIDGKVGYTGGVNLADEYNNTIRRFGYWKDGGIRLSGLAVEGLLKMFLSMWDYTAHTVSDYEHFLSSVEPSDSSDNGYYVPFGSGPAPIHKRPAGKNAFLNMINQAQDYVYITTPYLIIDYDLTEALCNAAYRGVDVIIITPGIADKKIVKVMTKSAYPYLIDAGVKIYEYRPGFIHEKTVISDDKYAIIGTINFDYRSLVHHFENAVWMFNTPAVISAKESFLISINESEKMDKKKSRLTPSEWFFKNIIRIFAPLL